MTDHATLAEIQPDAKEIARLLREQDALEQLGGMLTSVLAERREAIGTDANSYTYDAKTTGGSPHSYSVVARTRAAIKLCDALKAALEAELDRPL